LQTPASSGLAQKPIHIQMRRSGISPGAELDRADSFRSRDIEGFLERLVRK
jgi:hypothetical protein